MRWNIIEGDGVRLDSTSSQFPNLVAACSVVEMLIVSGVWHVHCWVNVIPGELWEFWEAQESEIWGELPPATDLMVEIPIESRPAPSICEINLHGFDTFFNCCCRPLTQSRRFCKILCERNMIWIEYLSWKSRLLPSLSKSVFCLLYFCIS